MNAKLIDAIKGVRDSLNVLVAELENRPVANAEPVVEAKTETPAETAPTMSRKEREASETLPDVTGTLTEEQLNSLSYNNLKKLAKEMGIPATGSRDELTAKILNAEVSIPAEDEAEEAPVEEAPKTKATKKTKPVAEPEPEEEEEEEEVDPLEARVMEAVEDMTNEEIADILADVGVVAKGKRQALISAVIKAVRDGKIDLDDESEDEEEEVEAPASEESEDEDFDVNDPENPDMTKERKTALVAHESETREGFESGEITRKEMIEWLNEFHGTKDAMKKKSDDEVLEEYIYCSSLLINDEGEMPEEEGAYTVNGIPYCCGHELKYNEDNETYICETCGAEYEAE